MTNIIEDYKRRLMGWEKEPKPIAVIEPKVEEIKPKRGRKKVKKPS